MFAKKEHDTYHCDSQLFSFEIYSENNWNIYWIYIYEIYLRQCVHLKHLSIIMYTNLDSWILIKMQEHKATYLK